MNEKEKCTEEKSSLEVRRLAEEQLFIYSFSRLLSNRVHCSFADVQNKQAMQFGNLAIQKKKFKNS